MKNDKRKEDCAFPSRKDKQDRGHESYSSALFPRTICIASAFDREFRQTMRGPRVQIRIGTVRTRVSFAKWQGTASRATSRSKKVARQRGSGVADSLPLGSGNLDVRLGGQWLLLAHALRTIELPLLPVKMFVAGNSRSYATTFLTVTKFPCQL
jgi:hypothetical protein